MNPATEHPHPLTAEGPGPVPTALVPHSLDERRLMRPPPLSRRLAIGIQRHPGPALLVAACAGFALGRLLRSAFRSLKER